MVSKDKYLFVVMMDVDADKEAQFNEIYDNEHIPLLREVPGVLGATRYETSTEGVPKYLAIYEVADPDVPSSEAFTKASNTGEWAPKIRPHTKNRSRIVYKLIYPKD